MMKSSRPDALAPTGEHAPSYYAATQSTSVRCGELASLERADVCVIGAGYTGLSAALHLARRGFSVIVLEQALLGWGASGRNGGQVHVGLRREQHWLEDKLGPTEARRLWGLSLEAREHVEWLLKTYAIDCDYRDGYLHADHKRAYCAHTRAYVEKLRGEYAYDSIRYVDEEEIRTLVATGSYFGGSWDRRGGHLHPLNFALGIARAAQAHGARLYERTEVTGIANRGGGWEVTTARGTVKSDRIVVACNGYLRGLSDDVAARVMPINNFVAVTEPLGEDRANTLIKHNLAVSDSRFVVHYYRLTPDHRLLFGGGENYTYRFPKDIAAVVRPRVLGVFPQLGDVKFDYAWGGTLSITPTRMPYLREVQAGCYNASGFSGLGVVLAPYAGKIVADAIAGDAAAFDAFSRVPVPRFPGGPRLRWPTLIAAMSFYALRDRL